jgi:hypothetical protein
VRLGLVKASGCRREGHGCVPPLRGLEEGLLGSSLLHIVGPSEDWEGLGRGQEENLQNLLSPTETHGPNCPKDSCSQPCHPMLSGSEVGSLKFLFPTS